MPVFLNAVSIADASCCALSHSFPALPHCTKPLRDSFGLTALVLLEGILSCAALDRMRDAVRLPPLTRGMDARTLLASEERTDTISHIAQTVPQCSSDARLRESATSVVRLPSVYQGSLISYIVYLSYR